MYGVWSHLDILVPHHTQGVIILSGEDSVEHFLVSPKFFLPGFIQLVCHLLTAIHVAQLLVVHPEHSGPLIVVDHFFHGVVQLVALD